MLLWPIPQTADAIASKLLHYHCRTPILDIVDSSTRSSSVDSSADTTVAAATLAALRSTADETAAERQQRDCCFLTRKFSVSGRSVRDHVEGLSSEQEDFDEEFDVAFSDDYPDEPEHETAMRDWVRHLSVQALGLAPFDVVPEEGFLIFRDQHYRRETQLVQEQASCWMRVCVSVISCIWTLVS